MATSVTVVAPARSARNATASRSVTCSMARSSVELFPMRRRPNTSSLSPGSSSACSIRRSSSARSVKCSPVTTPLMRKGLADGRAGVARHGNKSITNKLLTPLANNVELSGVIIILSLARGPIRPGRGALAAQTQKRGAGHRCPAPPALIPRPTANGALYCTVFIMSKIGRYIATTMPPTTTPRTTIIIGSISERSALTATSTSSS